MPEEEKPTIQTIISVDGSTIANVVQKKINFTREEALEEQVADLRKKLAALQAEKAQFAALKQRYEDQKDFYYQERVKSEQRISWLDLRRGRAFETVREYINAYWNLYGEFPKYVPVPSVLFRELGHTEKVEFYHFHRDMDYNFYARSSNFDHPVTERTKISVALVEVDN